MLLEKVLFNFRIWIKFGCKWGSKQNTELQFKFECKKVYIKINNCINVVFKPVWKLKKNLEVRRFVCFMTQQMYFPECIYQCWISLNCLVKIFFCHSISTLCGLWPFQIHAHELKASQFFNSECLHNPGQNTMWLLNGCQYRERWIRGSYPAVRNLSPFLNCKTQNWKKTAAQQYLSRGSIQPRCVETSIFSITEQMQTSGFPHRTVVPR